MGAARSASLSISRQTCRGPPARQDAELRHAPAKRVDERNVLARQELVSAARDTGRLLVNGLDGGVRTLGRVTASQIAAASTQSFFRRTAQALPSVGRIGRAPRPSGLRWRAPNSAVAQASIPTRQAGDEAKKAC